MDDAFSFGSKGHLCGVGVLHTTSTHLGFSGKYYAPCIKIYKKRNLHCNRMGEEGRKGDPYLLADSGRRSNCVGTPGIPYILSEKGLSL